MKKTIKEIFNDHKGKFSDKWTIYLDEWDRLFEIYHDDQINLLEIGIQNGGSLEVWAKYFSKAKRIIGCDIDEKCRELKFNDSRISVVVGDANTDECTIEILERSPTFDIIIDDGSHRSSDIICSFDRYFPHLMDGGLYIVEDLHTSYWKDYEGGLYDPNSSMSFFKRLADVINHEHWRNNESRKSYLAEYINNLGIKIEETDLERIHSIEIVNSMCVIKKDLPSKNELGKRIVVGYEGCVEGGWKQYNNTTIQEIPVVIDDYEDLDISEQSKEMNYLSKSVAEKEQTIRSMAAQITEREQTIQSLTNKLAQSQEEVLFYAQSKSWKITRPLRRITRLLKGKKNV